MSFSSRALRLLSTGAVTAALVAGTMGQASAATASKSLTHQQLLTLVRTTHFAPKGYYTSKKRGYVRELPAVKGVCGSVVPAMTEVGDSASKPNMNLTIYVDQLKSDAVAAKAFASMVDPDHVCGKERVTRPMPLPSNVRLFIQMNRGHVWRETLVAVEGRALVISQIQHVDGSELTPHDFPDLHFALHRTVAAYRAAAIS